MGTNLTKIFRAWLLTGCIFASCLCVQAQQEWATAANSNLSFGDGNQEKSVQLNDFLNHLEKQFGVQFAYNGLLVKNKEVSLEAIETKNLEGILFKTLTPLKLTYRKVGAHHYVVRKIEKSKHPIQKLKPAEPDFSGARKEKNLENDRMVGLQQLDQFHPGILKMLASHQGFSVSGVVTSDEGSTLPGVNVIVQGTNEGTVTDVNGNYTVDASENGTLIFSFVGYATREVPINGQSNINVTLEQSTEALDEVVVTAFGIERNREELAYGVSEVDGEDFTKAREINVGSALSGKVAGVSASGMNNGPGSSSRVLIRGTGSMSGNNQPLYVVNGMPMTNDVRNKGAQAGSQFDRGDGIQNINPDDIKSISVLKGGAAAALYGSQADNGVILIETKEGAYDQQGVGVEYNTNYMVGTINVFPDYQYEYGQGTEGQRPQTAKEALFQGRLAYGEKYDGKPSIQFDGVKRPYSPVGSGNTIGVKRNMKEFYRPSTTATNSLAFTGGNESARYRLSLSNLDAKAIQKKSEFSRQTANLNVSSKLSDRLSVESTIQYNHTKGNNRPGVGYADDNVNWGVSLVAPNVPIEALAPGYKENGDEILWQHVAVATNPYYSQNKMTNNDLEDRVMARGSFTYDIIPEHLYFKGDYMRDFSTFDAAYVIPKGNAQQPRGAYTSTKEDKVRDNLRGIMGYDIPVSESFGLSGMVGGNIERVNNNYLNYNGVDFILKDWQSLVNMATTETSEDVVRQGTNSLFASADLNYKRLIYLSLTGRQDWFSTLNPENNSILYPSVGSSFMLSKVVDLPEAISFAKLRGSWAQVGNATVSPYAINQTYGFRQGGHLGRPVQTMSSRLPNQDLRPLTSTTSELGLDLEFMDSQLGLDLTFYQKISEDDIVTTSIASSSGASSTILNSGEISNKGVEAMLSYRAQLANNLNWNVNYNVGYNKNEVLNLSPFQATGPTSLLGHPQSMQFDRGKATTEDGTPVFNPNSNYRLRSEPQPIGPGIAPTNMGLENTFTYKNLSLNVLLDAKFGNHFFSRHLQYMYRFGYLKETLPGRENGIDVEGVTEDGDAFQHHWPASFMATYYDHDKVYGKDFYVDGSFIKLRSLSLGYNLPVNSLNFIQSASISLVARNLSNIYRLTEHFDPEQLYQANDNEQDFAGTTLPQTRRMGFNLRVGF